MEFGSATDVGVILSTDAATNTTTVATEGLYLSTKTKKSQRKRNMRQDRGDH